ncbi:unnamed protein product [Didymodactylos carnosus]|uniref:Uncharacterized protein n=1 Tax=Didymodactylos carnosus TaxID=1234261 RepID=A0A815WFA4_9BILA|nr:unnamed protein product [Didymodactylos carnosus]CAF4402944.1 unnamed protein product [Didymodactylos carnosus]
MNLVKKVRPEIHIQPIPRPSPSVSTFFPVKDLIPKDLQSHIVYQLNCLDCEASYIGKTIRQIKRRLKEHGAPQPIKQSSLSHLSIDTPTSTQEVRRSARNTRKKVNYKEMNSPSNLDHEDIDLGVTTTNSALRKHELETKHTIDWLSLKILAKDNAKYISSTGHCFDIGNATRESLQNFIIKQKEFGKTHKISYEQMDSLSAENSERFKDEQSTSCSREGVAGSGPLMRLAPIPLFFYRSPSHAIRYAGESAILTHRDDRARDACRYYAALIAGALQGYSKTDLLDKKFYLSRKNEKWFGEGDEAELHSDIQKIAKALEAALWAFWCDDGSFKKGALQVVNLGDDTSTTAAIYGQLAGAYYGIHALPDEWSKVVHAREFILCLSEWLMHEGYKWHELCEMNKSK